LPGNLSLKQEAKNTLSIHLCTIAALLNHEPQSVLNPLLPFAADQMKDTGKTNNRLGLSTY